MIKQSKIDFQERIPRSVYRLYFETREEKVLDLVRGVLLNLGFHQEDLVSSSINAKFYCELFNESPVRLKKINKLFSSLKLPDLKVSFKRMAPKDWLTLWKSHWKPSQLTNKLDVVPVWYQHKYKKAENKDYILMDTLLSFGTGLHETTRFMAQFIEDKKGCFKSFLDIGTGTGILSFVALKHGALDVAGIDIGQLSVQAAKDNMKVNNLYFKVEKRDIKKFVPKISYDFVAANLITDDLIQNAQKLISFVKEGGFLALSGISLENLDRFRRSFASKPLKCLKISKGKQWSGLLYQKKAEFLKNH